MATFELTSSSCDGHIRALSKAVVMASRLSREALLEFTPEKMRLCARTDLYVVKFVFKKDFFNKYHCESKQRVCIHLKALLLPFKSSILVSDRDYPLRSSISLKCSVENEVRSQIVFKIGADPPSATLSYRLIINDIDQEIQDQQWAMNRTIEQSIVTIAPKQTKKERFLLSAFNNFAPDIDQVSIKVNSNEVKFIGSSSPLLTTPNTTSEFTHKREDFSIFNVKEDVNITIPLRYLKLFLTFVETNRVHTDSKYIFEGEGQPAHFIYDAKLFKGHFISATPIEYVPAEISDEIMLPIGQGPDASYLADESVMQANDDIDITCNTEPYYNNIHTDDIIDDEDGYNDNQSEASDLLDGNLEGFNTSGKDNSIFGLESIRSEIGETVVTSETAKQILDFDKEVEDIDAVMIHYSSDSDED